jgi:hypothetical protein
MSVAGTCLIHVAGREHVESVPFTFSAEDIALLRSYLGEAQRLQGSILANGGFPVSMQISATIGEPSDIGGKQPTDDQLAIFLHRLRPFQLQRERHHFGKVKNVVARGTAASDFMKSYLSRTADMFFGHAMPLRMSIREGETLDYEALVTAWLNAEEYHRDDTKMRAVLKGQERIPDRFARPIIMLILKHKVDAVLALGNIIYNLLFCLDHTELPDTDPPQGDA